MDLSVVTYFKAAVQNEPGAVPKGEADGMRTEAPDVCWHRGGSSWVRNVALPERKIEP